VKRVRKRERECVWEREGGVREREGGVRERDGWWVSTFHAEYVFNGQKTWLKTTHYCEKVSLTQFCKDREFNIFLQRSGNVWEQAQNVITVSNPQANNNPDSNIGFDFKAWAKKILKYLNLTQSCFLKSLKSTFLCSNKPNVWAQRYSSQTVQRAVCCLLGLDINCLKFALAQN